MSYKSPFVHLYARCLFCVFFEMRICGQISWPAPRGLQRTTRTHRKEENHPRQRQRKPGQRLTTIGGKVLDAKQQNDLSKGCKVKYLLYYGNGGKGSVQYLHVEN